MPRVTHVKSARKDNPACKKGESYYWWKFRYGSKHYSLTYPKASQLTQSEKLSAIYSAGESIEASPSGWGEPSTPEELEQIIGEINQTAEIIKDAAEQIREAGEGYRESAQNIEDGFGHRTEKCDELDERADQCDNTADELESFGDEVETAASDLESAEVEDEVDEPTEPTEPKRADFEEEDDFDEAVDEYNTEFADYEELLQAFENAVDGYSAETLEEIEVAISEADAARDNAINEYGNAIG